MGDARIQATRVAERRWQVLLADGAWDDVVGVTEVMVTTAAGFGILCRDLLRMDGCTGLRYSIIFRGAPMPWRTGGAEKLPLLLADFGLPEVADAICEEQARARQERMGAR